MSFAAALKIAANAGNEFDSKIRAALPVLAAEIRRLEAELSLARVQETSIEKN